MNYLPAVFLSFSMLFISCNSNDKPLFNQDTLLQPVIQSLILCGERTHEGVEYKIMRTKREVAIYDKNGLIIFLAHGDFSAPVSNTKLSFNPQRLTFKFGHFTVDDKIYTLRAFRNNELEIVEISLLDSYGNVILEVYNPEIYLPYEIEIIPM